MNTRSFKISEYNKVFDENRINKDNFETGLIIIRTILSDIDIILQDYQLPQDKVQWLKEKKLEIADIYNKYYDLFSKKRILDEYNALNFKPVLTDAEKDRLNFLKNIGLKMLRQQSFSDSNLCALIPQYELEETLQGDFDFEQVESVYESIYKDYQTCFELENKIHQEIVIPIWKEYLTKYNPQYQQGEHFAYLFHSGGGFVVLPGMKQFSTKTSEYDSQHKTDFISASLITEREMESGNTNVGIIIGLKNKTILASFHSDCGTRESTEESVTNIKINKATNNAVSIGSPRMALPVSKLGTPKNIERQAMQASISNTGEILNAGQWIYPIYTEVVTDKEDFELEAIFFKTTGCDINLKDFIIAKQMEMYYGKPLQIVNQSICRENANLSPYTEEEKQRFENQLMFFSNPNNYKIFDQNPVLFKNIIKLYYQEVIERAGFKGETKLKAQAICLKIVEYLNSIIKEQGLEDSSLIKLDDIMNLNLDKECFPKVKYTPETRWGKAEVKKEDIQRFVFEVPRDLQTKVQESLLSDVSIEKNMEER